MDFVYDFLEKNRYTSRQVYDHYAAEMRRIVKVRNADYETLLRSLGQTRRQQEERLEKTKALLLDEQDGEIRGHFKGDLNAIEQKVQETAASIERAKADLERNNQAILTYEQFVELFGNIPERLRKVTAMADLDFIIRKFFLNFTVKDKKVASYTQNSPFGEFAGHGYIRDGRAGGDRTHDFLFRKLLVGVVGIEPTTSCSQSRRATAAPHSAQQFPKARASLPAAPLSPFGRLGAKQLAPRSGLTPKQARSAGRSEAEP